MKRKKAKTKSPNATVKDVFAKAVNNAKTLSGGAVAIKFYPSAIDFHTSLYINQAVFSAADVLARMKVLSTVENLLVETTPTTESKPAFARLCATLRRRKYNVEHRVLNTDGKLRLWLVARKRPLKPQWPIRQPLKPETMQRILNGIDRFATTKPLIVTTEFPPCKHFATPVKPKAKRT